MPNLIPNSLSRPADVFLPTWSRGRPAALDVHVISPLQQQTLGEAASTPGHVLQVGIQRKLASHLEACRSAGVDFVPIVAEALGGLAEDSIFTIRSIRVAISQRVSPQDSTTCTKQLFHRVAIALWAVAGKCLPLAASPAQTFPQSERFSLGSGFSVLL